MQSVKSALGIIDESTPGVKTMEDHHTVETTNGTVLPTLDAVGKPAVLPGIMDYEEGNNTKDGALGLESASSNNSGLMAKEKIDLFDTNETDSSTEEIPLDDFEYKLSELVGENNMSNLPKPASRPGDTVVFIPCPEHEVDFVAMKGFFILDLNSLNKKTRTELSSVTCQRPEDALEKMIVKLLWRMPLRTRRSLLSFCVLKMVQSILLKVTVVVKVTLTPAALGTS